MKAPPAIVFVSWCTRCGGPIVANLEPNIHTVCPDCPGRSPRIIVTRYRLDASDESARAEKES